MFFIDYSPVLACNAGWQSVFIFRVELQKVVSIWQQQNNIITSRKNFSELSCSIIQVSQNVHLCAHLSSKHVYLLILNTSYPKDLLLPTAPSLAYLALRSPRVILNSSRKQTKQHFCLLLICPGFSSTRLPVWMSTCSSLSSWVS